MSDCRTFTWPVFGYLCIYSYTCEKETYMYTDNEWDWGISAYTHLLDILICTPTSAISKCTLF